MEASSRRQRYVRAEKPSHPITPLKLEVLAAVASCGYLSTPQVCAATGMSERTIKDHLRDLFDAGLLDVISVPGAAVGSTAVFAPKVHRPTAEGMRRLRKLDMLPADAFRTRTQELSSLSHGLAARDVFAWLSREARKNGHQLERFALARIPPVHGTVPDAVFVYRMKESGPGSVMAGFVEADMGTERAMSGASDRWARKLEGYGAAYDEEKRPAVIAATGYKNARLIVVVPSEARAQWVARRAAESVAASRMRIAVRGELGEARLSDPIWMGMSPDGEWSKGGFLSGNG